MARVVERASPRQLALEILYAIEVEGAYADVALRQRLRHSRLSRRDRAFVTECVYGVVRWRERLDWLLSQVCRYPLCELTPWIRNALRLGVYQCLWLRVPAWAAVHETVALARRYGHRGTAQLVNGVLRALLRQHASWAFPDAATQPVAHLAVVYSYPTWLVARWLERYGWERTRALCEANNRVEGVTLRVNTLRTSPQALAQRLCQEGLRQVAPSALLPEGLVVRGTDRLDTLPSYREGLFQVQDEGAMLVAHACQVRPGQRVLDACAAPGGKTTHLAQLMEDTGWILACDPQWGRLRLVQHNVERLRLRRVALCVADARRPPLAPGALFDRILVDAPCSGLGVVRRHPDIKWRRTPADLAALSALQLELLHAQVPLLAPAGLLIYSVCSNEPEETWAVVSRFLAAHPELHLQPLATAALPPAVRPALREGVLDLTPEVCGTEGVFVACFGRQG
ncbi:MAG: ribosomal RNA small subunit methyltransferase B [Candidatus Tectimicrobiota bacterium]|nr:MAG: ribosomal RNA small subunit methyltransferase B [Candidatus Tectomicrobia bacterium]